MTFLTRLAAREWETWEAHLFGCITCRELLDDQAELAVERLCSEGQKLLSRWALTENMRRVEEAS